MADDKQDDLFTKLPAVTPLSRVQQRLIRSAVEIQADDPEAILYQHTVFCQTGLPYRDPGKAARLWQRSQGAAHLEVEAGRAFHPEKGGFVDVGLPFGPKPRLILAYLNAEAIRTSSPIVEVEDSLCAFVRRIGLSRDGRSIRAVKDQLTRLATAEIRLALAMPGTPAKQVQAHIVKGFELWLPKDEHQRVLWPANVTLSTDYFESLSRHAVPLDERAIAALSHSAMALDLYCWLAQRLHRVEPGKAAFIPWTALKAQFGWHYDRMRKFREVFRQTLDLVCSQYRGARIELDGRGMTLRNSPPPVKGRVTVIRHA
jgi:Plasmid encoded RepA protein